MKHTKKLFALILALALVLPALLMPASAAQASFSDVKSSDWFYPYVTRLAQAGGINGYPDGTFKPKNNITRAEVANIANNLFQPGPYLETYVPEDFYNSYASFIDRSYANYWARDAIFYAALSIDSPDFINGFDWKQPATRADIALILGRVYSLVMYFSGVLSYDDLGAPEEAVWLVGDYEKIKGTEAEWEIVWQYANGIVSGVNDRGDFNPDGYATRAECSKIVVNLMDPSQRDVVDWSKAKPGGNDSYTDSDGIRYEKDFTGTYRARYPGDVAFDYCRALEKEIGIQIFYIPYEWTEGNGEALIHSDEAFDVIVGNGLDNFFPAVLAELKKMKDAYDKYPDGFLKEMVQKKGSRKAEIILCPYTFEGMLHYGRYVYNAADGVDQVYYTGVGDTEYYSHEMGHMVVSAASILNGYNATVSAWEKMMTADGGSYVSYYAITSRPEDQAETWAYLWEQPQTVIQACSNAGLKAKVQYLTQILDKNYSTFHANQVPWASVLK